MTSVIFDIDLAKQKINSALLLSSLVLGFVAFLTQNTGTTLVSILVLNIIVRLFNKPGLPAVILAGLIFQWLQISIKVWHANFSGIHLSETFSLYGGNENFETAFYLSSIGLVALSLGLYLVISKIDNRKFFRQLVSSLDEYQGRKIVILYVIISISLSALIGFRLSIPGINTIVVALGKLKWGFYLLYFLSVVYGKNTFKLFFLITAFEIVISLSGYFSEFKLFIIFLAIGFLSFTNILSFQRGLVLGLLMVFAFHFGVLWTAIKGDYRDYLSGGTDRQVVLVSTEDALTRLLNLTQTLDDSQYDEAIDYLIDRVSFIEFFALTLNHVPSLVPHQDGDLWTEALTFYFKPRLFFPNKRVIDDSEHTSQYTGLYLATASQGASHSIGFMTDSYIDYGPILMFVPIFLLGVLISWAFKHLLLKSGNAVWGLVFSTPFYLLTSFYSFNLIKVIGNFVIYMVVILLLRKWIIRFVDPLLR